MDENIKMIFYDIPASKIYEHIVPSNSQTGNTQGQLNQANTHLMNSYVYALYITHGLATSYDDINLGQHWLR